MNAIEVRGRRTDGSGRWFRLRLSLRPKRSGPLVTHPAGFTCGLQAADDLAATYKLENWESGIVSGLGFALRRTPDRDWGVELSVVEGTVGSPDMTGLARAATIAAFRLHGLEPPTVSDKDWEFQAYDVGTVLAPETGSGASNPVQSPASIT